MLSENQTFKENVQFWFYLSPVLHLDGDSLVRELHEEPHQLHFD